MANVLKMAIVHSILHLNSLQWSRRRIARELGVDRGTVGRCLLRHLRPPNAAISPPGSEAPEAGRNAADQSAVLLAGHDTPACRAPSVAGRKSECQPWRELIEAKLTQGLSAQRIWQDLRSDHGFPAGYDCVKRFVRRLRGARPLPFRRLESAPGDESQADFGAGAPIVTAALTPRGKPQRKKTHLFRIVLSHSRKAYSEVTYLLCALLASASLQPEFA